MFPFIWWLGEQATPAVAVDGGGGDFFRRRIIMATGQTAWDPSRLGPNFWIAPVLSDVVVDADPDVLSWRSRGTDGQSIAASGSLEWRPTGWSDRTPSAYYSQVGGGPFLVTTSGDIASFGSGSDVTFSILVTLRADLVADHVICGWDDTTPGSSLSLLRVNNLSGGKLRYVRNDSVGGGVTVDGLLDIGLSHQRVGIAFRGTTVDLFVGRALDVSAACDVASMTLNRFRIGTGPGIDAFTGLIPEVVIVPRAISIAEWMAYYDGSVARFGV